jgi:hypothetical protein
MPVEIAKNVYVETVGDILDGGEPVTPPEIVGWLEPPRLADKTPPVPSLGFISICRRMCISRFRAYLSPASRSWRRRPCCSGPIHG